MSRFIPAQRAGFLVELESASPYNLLMMIEMGNRKSRNFAMPIYSGLPTGEPLKRVVVPEITRGFWSRKRMLLGQKIKIHLETANIPDSTPVKIEIWKGEPDRGEKLEDISGKQIDKCELCFEHKPKVKEKQLEKAVTPVYFKAIVDKFKVSEVSEKLDLLKFQFSR